LFSSGRDEVRYPVWDKRGTNEIFAAVSFSKYFEGILTPSKFKVVPGSDLIYLYKKVVVPDLNQYGMCSRFCMGFKREKWLNILSIEFQVYPSYISTKACSNAP
jgi:hypothetical protein